MATSTERLHSAVAFACPGFGIQDAAQLWEVMRPKNTPNEERKEMVDQVIGKVSCHGRLQWRREALCNTRDHLKRPLHW